MQATYYEMNRLYLEIYVYVKTTNNAKGGHEFEGEQRGVYGKG